MIKTVKKKRDFFFATWNWKTASKYKLRCVSDGHGHLSEAPKGQRAYLPVYLNFYHFSFFKNLMTPSVTLTIDWMGCVRHSNIIIFFSSGASFPITSVSATINLFHLFAFFTDTSIVVHNYFINRFARSSRSVWQFWFFLLFFRHLLSCEAQSICISVSNIGG